MGELAHPIKTRFMRWYYSSTKAARFTRRAYRRSYFAIFGYVRIFYVFADRELVYLEVPKAACTSIKATMGRSYGINKEDGRMTASPLWHKEYGKLPRKLEGYFKFSFVRNPFSRLVSCYIDKIYRKRARGGSFTACAFRNLPTDISFHEFVQNVIKIPDRWADHHFKSQYAILFQRGRLVPDWIGYLENIQHDWKTLASRFDLLNEIEYHHSTREQGLYVDFRSFYTPELVDLVYDRYWRDFETFGYSGAYHELLAYIKSRGEHG